MSNADGFRPWAIAALGAAGGLCAPSIWQAAQSTGGPALVCSVALAAGGVGVLAAWSARKGHSLAGTMPKAYVEPREEAWAQALTPEGWLRRSGSLSVPDGELEVHIRARLIQTLSPLPENAEAPGQAGLPEPLALLALALIVRAGQGNLQRRLDSREILDGLDRAMAKPEGAGRDAALASVRKRTGYVRGLPSAYGKALAAHATRETMFMGLLAQAWQVDGPLGTGEFVWLKAFDRGLWYALLNLGRPAPLVEGLAAMDHFLHETALGHAVGQPHVDDAVTFLAGFRRNPLCCDQTDGLKGA